MKHTIRRQCEHPGCNEFRFYGYDTLRDMREAQKNQRPEFCVRHTKPSEVLSAANMQTEHVFVNQANASLGKRFWNGSSGFAHGPGFKAFSEDFPPGTRIVVTARLELPDLPQSLPQPVQQDDQP